MSTDEEQWPPAEWNSTDREYSPLCAHELFEQRAAETPDAPALLFDDQRFTYEWVNIRANRLARHLQNLGVGPEVPVGLCFDRSAEGIVALLGILKAGGAYVPLEPGYPRQRLTDLIADSQVKLVVCAVEHRDLIAPLASAICLSDAPMSGSGNPASGAGPDTLAYIVYTSGTTGRPKGVLGVHRSITNRLHALPFRDPATEVACLNSSISFGFSIARIFLPLITGVPLVILREDDVRDFGRLASRIEETGVTNLAFVTPLLRQLLAAGPRVTNSLRRLRTVTVGGSDVTPDLVASFERACPQATLLNCYAATEVGSAISLATLTASSAARVSAGRPIANTRLYIVDREMRLVPVGVTGELMVGAEHLARGYLNQPALTAARFVPDPFGNRPGQRLYRTGDLARYRSDGEIELMGREDDLVKVRGYRIELGEIATTLRRLTGVRDAVVTTRTHDSETQLVAYVAVAPGAAITRTSLGAYCQAQLPEYMLPAEFVLVDDLPLTAVGKVDLSALAHIAARSSKERPYDSPRDGGEMTIADIWSEVLGVERVGIHDHFFLDLGGNSLLAARAAVRLQQQGLDVTVSLIFEQSTVALIAASLRNSTAS